MVGWPPVRSFRKKALKSCSYVKVAVDGAPYLRKVDLEIYSGYQDLLAALEEMFSCFTTRECLSLCWHAPPKPYLVCRSLSHRLNLSSIVSPRELPDAGETGGHCERHGVRPDLRGQRRRLDARRRCPLEVRPPFQILPLKYSLSPVPLTAQRQEASLGSIILELLPSLHGESIIGVHPSILLWPYVEATAVETRGSGENRQGGRCLVVASPLARD